MTAQTIDTEASARQWAAWHRRHEAVRADPHGFLAITGLHWLSPGPPRFADAPGTWSAGPGGVTVVLGETEELAVGGEPVYGTHSFGVIPERGGVSAVSGDSVIEVARRGGYDIVRPRHPDHPLRVGYASIPAYAPDPAWVIAGRYVSLNEPRDATVGAAADGTVTLDFNRAVNLPCACTSFATCPLPPAENRLPVAVEAGEKDPPERD
jgi:uncharacterized protein